MKNKIIFSIIFLGLTSMFSGAQSDLNGYKYIIIPEKYSFQRFDDQYQLNSLTEFLFNKEGFTTLVDGKRPNDLYDNPCLGVTVDLLNNSSMFNTKVVLKLVDCKDVVVYTSEEGGSKLKEYKRGYHEAIRKAFQSFKALDHNYDSSLAVSVKPIDEEKNTESIIESQPNAEKVAPVEKQMENIEAVVEEEAVDNSEMSNVNLSNNAQEIPAIIEDNTKNVLYAQKISNGFQLVDGTPKVIYKLLKTSKDNVYLLEGKSGIMYKSEGKWFAEYYKSGVLTIEELTIKF